MGIEFNQESMRWRVESSSKPNADALYAIVRASGMRTWYGSEYSGYWDDCVAGNQPLDEHDVHLERWDNDGSQEWKDMADRVKRGPVRDGGA